jgi:hypothetical protein
MNTHILHLGEKGNHLGNAFTGSNLREEVEKIFNNYEEIIVDFNGVETISKTFAKYFYAKLLDTFSKENIKKKVKIENANLFITTPIMEEFDKYHKRLNQDQLKKC